MAKSMSKKVRDSRLLLSNQFAYLNDVGSYSVSVKGEAVEVLSSDEITASRLLLQDPYAHLDDLGGFSSADNTQNDRPEAFRKAPRPIEGIYASMIRHKRTKGRHSNAEIEAKAIDLQRRIWRDRDQIWSDSPPTDPIDILDPSVAFRLLGYDFDTEATLGQYSSNGNQIEVAGTIDESTKQARISLQFPYDVRNFTAAHELGHALLHDARGMHRDRPLDGATISREPTEIEADKFAAYFLMPSKLVKACFERLFGPDRFVLDDDTGFALARGTSLDLRRDCATPRDLAKVLASAESYNGLRFASLAQQFRVSTGAMAIRLEELKLVEI